MKIAKLLLLLLAAAVSSNAATLTYSGSVSLQRTNWSQTINLPQFDPALGTLNSITFSLSTYAEGICFGENGSVSSPTSLTLQLEAEVKMKNGSNLLAGTYHGFCNETIDVSVGEGLTGPLPIFGFTIPGFNGTGPDAAWRITQSSESNSNTIFSGFSPYEGLGTIPFTIGASAISKSSGGGNTLFMYQVKVQADASVVYDYTPVPEPSGIFTVLAGLGSAAGIFIRRKQ